jgi:hypothetical protein
MMDDGVLCAIVRWCAMPVLALIVFLVAHAAKDRRVWAWLAQFVSQRKVQFEAALAANAVETARRHAEMVVRATQQRDAALKLLASPRVKSSTLLCLPGAVVAHPVNFFKSCTRVIQGHVEGQTRLHTFWEISVQSSPLYFELVTEVINACATV